MFRGCLRVRYDRAMDCLRGMRINSQPRTHLTGYHRPWEAGQSPGINLVAQRDYGWRFRRGDFFLVEATGAQFSGGLIANQVSAASSVTSSR